MSLEQAESWFISQHRGNNGMSDDRVVHRMLDELEEYMFGLVASGGLGAAARLRWHDEFRDKVEMSQRELNILWCANLLKYGENCWDEESDAWRIIDGF